MSQRTILVLGATGGIGRALVRRLHEDGAALGLAARSAEALTALAAETGGLALPLDARRVPDVVRAAEATRDAFGQLDGIVNCVGSLLLKPAHLTSEDEWEQVLAQNLGTAWAAIVAAATVMPGPGSVVLIASAAARVGLANHEAIAAAKAGVIGLATSAAASYAGRGLRVNVVAPGLVRTPMTASLTSAEPVLKASAQMHPLGRIGEPGEVADAIAWLLGDSASWVTGQVLGVDGGLATVRSRR